MKGEIRARRIDDYTFSAIYFFFLFCFFENSILDLAIEDTCV